MNYRYSSYTLDFSKYKKSKIKVDSTMSNFAMFIPQKGISKDELKQYYLTRLKDIIGAYGVEFFEYKKEK